jgi:hypothetical protein
MKPALLRPALFLVSSLLFAVLATAVVLGQQWILLSGVTSDGHHLIEDSCSSCHSPFRGVSNPSCSTCHQAELAADLHPASLFNDPRWAADLDVIDATRCVTCHREHRVAGSGVTIDRDFCIVCHGFVLEEESHRGFQPAGCWSGGCHNYHDGFVLRPDRLAVHRGEPALLAGFGVLDRRLPEPEPRGNTAFAADPPPDLAAPKEVVDAWQASAHPTYEVGCASCHVVAERVVSRPGPEACRTCHAFEVETFLQGKHGVRTGLGLAALRPRDARLPMTPAAVAGHRSLGCGTCHDPHRLDTRRAATDACLQCHADRHSTSFLDSPHARLGETEAPRERPGSREVTCATCHLPRVEVAGPDGTRVAVNHNNSLTLRPAGRSAAMVCTSCHGLELAFASLLDEGLVARNFAGRPHGRLKTFLMLDRQSERTGDAP